MTARARWALGPALGAIMALGQAPWGLWPLTVAGAAVLLATLPDSPRAAAHWLWLAGAGYFALALAWIVEPFLVDAARHGWMAPFALVFMAGGMALFWGAAGLAVPGGRALVVPAFIALELARGWVLTGFPWAMLGHALIDTPLVQLASLGGAGLLSLLVLGAAALAGLPRGPRARAAGALAGAALLAGGWGWGALRPPLPAPDGPVVRLAQPDAPQDQKWQDDAGRFFARLLRQTAAPGTPAPALVVWPETAVPFLLNRPGAGLARMAATAAVHGPDMRIAFGVQRLQAGHYYNSLAVLDGDATVAARYDKHHLVPFGEYVPLAGWLTGTPIGGLAGQALQGYSPGPGPQLLDLGPLGHALPLICYEAIFPRNLRGTARPDWLLHATNDAWFGQVSGPYQHLAQARLRAVELGLPLLRSANTGVSAVIDARGKVLDRLPLGRAGYIDTALPAALPPTVYAGRGDGPLWLALALFAATALAARRQSNHL